MPQASDAATGKRSILDLWLAGAAGGISGVLMGHPIDTVVVWLQTGQYKNINDVVRNGVRKHGAAALYRGVTTPITSVVFTNSFFFYVYRETKRNIGADWMPWTAYVLRNPVRDWKSCALEGAVAGTLTGTVMAFVMTPRDLVKTRMQGVPQISTLPKKTPSMIETGRKVFQKEGIAGLYRGLSMVLWRDTIGNAAYFGVYEAVKRVVTPENAALPSSLGFITAGGCAGLAFWGTIYPFDSVKSRLMSEMGRMRYDGAWHCIREMMHEGGIRALYKGYAVCMMRAFPTSAVNFGMYETTLRILAVLRQEAS